MKRKYYMRGLGIGVVITAIVCAVALPKQTEPMTDAEVIARAKELGYVKATSGVTAEDIDKLKENEKASGIPDETEGAETTKEPEGTPGPTLSPEPTPQPPEEPDQPDVPATPTPKPEIKPTATTAPPPTATPVPTKKPTEAPKATATPVGTDTAEKSYTITIERGMTATRVAERLASVGAISDVTGFIRYLRNNNLTDYINIGTFTIPKGAGNAEIAQIITGR